MSRRIIYFFFRSLTAGIDFEDLCCRDLALSYFRENLGFRPADLMVSKNDVVEIGRGCIPAVSFADNRKLPVADLLSAPPIIKGVKCCPFLHVSSVTNIHNDCQERSEKE